jgi:phospholipid/cholesterol/gamma-HCH transport system substrate-binding protein
MKNTLETRLGLFAALIVIAAVLILETLGGLDNLKKGTRVRALFNTAQELKVGDRVKMAGVEIGRVEKILLTDNKVEVTMKLKSASAVKTDSIASIRFAGLMGQNFVSLEFGSAAALPADNNTILPTTEQPDLNAIMKRLDNVAGGVENLTKSFSGDKIDNILGPLTDFFKQNNDKLGVSLGNIKTITTQIAEGKGTVGKLIMEDTLYTSTLTTVSNLQDTTADMRATIADARSVISDAKAGKGTVGKLLTDETLYNETTDSMTNLKEILQKVNRGDGTVGKLVNDQEFYKNAKMTLQKLDKATESLEDQGPISVMGTMFQTFY